jgi:hypothetical protein
VSKVFGIGFHKTGTTTLGQCLSYLGYNCLGYRPDLLEQIHQGDFVATFAAVEQFNGFQDWPWPLIYKQLDERYPESKFVLTIRQDEEIWLRSLLKHAARKGPSRTRELIYNRPMPHGYEREHIERYIAHNQEAKEYFMSQPDKLLIICWETGTGWQELCSFLDKPVPDIPLPHLNISPDFLKLQKRALKKFWRQAKNRLSHYGFRHSQKG